jgi:hypothetical protein
MDKEQESLRSESPAELEAPSGLGHILALHHRASTSYQTR